MTTNDVEILDFSRPPEGEKGWLAEATIRFFGVIEVRNIRLVKPRTGKFFPGTPSYRYPDGTHVKIVRLARSLEDVVLQALQDRLAAER